MDRMIRCAILMLCTAAAAVAGPKPIDYVVNSSGSRMTIAVNGPVEWKESISGTTMTITMTAPARHFIVKKINYNFRDGVIRSFAMTAVHPDTEQIRIALRRDQAYDLSYDASAKRFVIRFFNGAMMPPNTAAAAAVTERKSSKKKPQPAVAAVQQRSSARKETAAPAAAPIDIPSIAVRQVEQPAADAAPAQTIPAEPASAMNASAVLLLIASTLIILAGGGAVAYVIVTRRFTRTAPQQQQQQQQREELPAPAPAAGTPFERAAAKEETELSEEEQEFEMAVEYAEQYLRSQGEFELQQRLEQLNSSSMQKRLEMAAVHPSSRKGNSAAAAEKLGISIGELDLASRLQKFHTKQMTESV